MLKRFRLVKKKIYKRRNLKRLLKFTYIKNQRAWSEVWTKILKSESSDNLWENDKPL